MDSQPDLKNLAAQETDDIEAMKSSLPKEKGYLTDHFYKYQGFWYDEHFLKGVVWAQARFEARPTDILLATFPKTGLTWLKALVFTITNRTDHPGSTHPLLAKNPHELVPYLEFQAYEKTDLNSVPSPRLLSTHIPYGSLPKSVAGSRIVCIARDPKDVFVSMWSFISKIVTVGNKIKENPITKEETFDMFCNGVTLLGPFWDHVAGYYAASREFPTRVLFLKYEDLKRNPAANVERLAEFIGRPFSREEMESGAVEEIVKLCGIEKLKELEVNRNGVYRLGSDSKAFVEKSAYFRKGEVGDWKNHLTEEMAEKIDRISEEKFGAYGFKY